ncbi:MAG: prepilin-type N-terminal cleavage/methylation domain-containing protein [Candidatus Zapsychrus exili]|nr:prepilin-type N-terminal cleavage/methylation domain-containing protein [Candidatus Zapsychrus exili]
MSNKKGFTLIEIIIVIIIVGAIAGLALPRFGLTFEKIKSQEGVQILTSVYNAQKIYYVENGAYATSMGSLDITVPTPQHFAAPVPRNNPSSTVVRIDRSTGAYRLIISYLGTINCQNYSPYPSCTQIGY